MRILITRPGEDGMALAEVLKTSGIETVVEPLLAIKHINGPMLDVHTVQALLLTSANGARALARRTDRRDIPVYAVGDSTATRARREGFAQVHSAAGNVEALVGLVKDLLNPKDGPLLHIAGSEVAGDLIGLLETVGFNCTREVLYEAIPERTLKSSTIAALKDRQIDAVTLYSPRSAENFVGLIRKARLVRSCRKITAVCLSQAVAAKINEIQWLNILIAAEPNQDALLKLVIGLYENKIQNNVAGSKIIEVTDQTINKHTDKTDANLANEIAQNTLPSHGSGGGTIRTVFFTLLVIAILIGLGFATKPLWPTKFYSFASIFFEAPDKRIKLSALSGRLTALENTQQIPKFDELQRERERLQTKLDATLKRVTALENSINSTKKMIKAVNVEAGVEATKTLNKLVTRIQKLEKERLNYRAFTSTKDGKTIEKLAEEVTVLEQKISSPIRGNQSTEARALVLSIGLLRESVRAGRPFDNELAALNVLVETNQQIKVPLRNEINKFERFSKSGVPNLLMLRTQFAEKAGSIVQAALLPSDGGWVERTLARLAESVKWRRTDNFIGNGAEAVVSRTEWALKSGDIAKAIKELSVLDGKSGELTASWLNGARAYITVEKALAGLQTQVVAQMTMGQ